MAKVIVTGGAGFVGSHLTDALIEQGHVVVVLDNLSTGKLEQVNNKAVFVKGDIRNAEDVEKIFSDYRINTVYHLAAQIYVQKSVEDPAYDADVNIHGTLNLLQNAKRSGVKNFVYFSSAAVYGNPSRVPISVSDPTIPINPYGASKLAAESYCRLFKKNMNVTIVRPFNIYGSRQDSKSPYAGVITLFTEKAKRDEPLTIYGDGEQTRDFIPVEQVVSKTIELTGKPGTYNLGTGKATTINEVAERIIKEHNSGSEIIHEKAREGDIRHSVALV